MQLVVCEKPSVAATLAKALGAADQKNGYTYISSDVQTARIMTLFSEFCELYPAHNEQLECVINEILNYPESDLRQKTLSANLHINSSYLSTVFLAQTGIRFVDYVNIVKLKRAASLDFGQTRHETVTEISCHGLGASYLGDNIHTIIDIGGQDSKAIKIDPETGKVLDFAMNDKCAAGTGRFLEKAANLLELDVTEIGDISLRSKQPSDISSQCVVFSESEIISGRARGDNVADIAAGIHLSVAKRVNGLLHRIGTEPNVLFTGGVSNNIGMVKALNKILGFDIQIPKIDTVYAGAIGAALFASKYAESGKIPLKEAKKEFRLDLSRLTNAVEKRKKDFAAHNTGKAKNAAYLCSYTPQEILSAADVAHLRLIHAGSQREIMSGEAITQSVFCDFTKSVLGGFEEKNELYSGIDKVYNFYTCDCMRKTTEAIPCIIPSR